MSHRDPAPPMGPTSEKCSEHEPVTGSRPESAGPAGGRAQPGPDYLTLKDSVLLAALRTPSRALMRRTYRPGLASGTLLPADTFDGLPPTRASVGVHSAIPEPSRQENLTTTECPSR